MGVKMTVEGTVHRILPEQKFESGFRKRNLVLKTGDGNPDRPDYALFEFTGGRGGEDRTALLGRFAEGDRVAVTFVPTARESVSKPGLWFGSNRGLAIERRA